MGGQAKAASPGLTVVGELVRRHAEHHASRTSCLLDLLDALGIDPDMSVETLRRRLEWGERVEGIKYQATFGDDYEEGIADGVKWTLRQIVRPPDNTDSPGHAG